LPLLFIVALCFLYPDGFALAFSGLLLGWPSVATALCRRQAVALSFATVFIAWLRDLLGRLVLIGCLAYAVLSAC